MPAAAAPEERAAPDGDLADLLLVGVDLEGERRARLRELRHVEVSSDRVLLGDFLPGLSAPPLGHARLLSAISSAMIAIAISSGDSAPISRPMGLCARFSSASVNPSARSSSKRAFRFALLPIIPRYASGMPRRRRNARPSVTWPRDTRATESRGAGTGRSE